MTFGATVSLGAINMQADDPAALAGFWAALTGGTIAGSAGGSVFVAAREPGGFALFFQPRSGPRTDQQDLHLDLTVPWTTRVAEIERAVGLGAVRRWDVLDEVPWVRWTTLADPEGNLFCLAEHPPTWDGQVT